MKSRQGTERDKRRKVKGQRNCQAIRNSVKETVSLLLKNKSYCPSENDSISTSWSSKTSIAYHLWKVRFHLCNVIKSFFVIKYTAAKFHSFHLFVFSH